MIYKKLDILNQVSVFHKLFNQPIEDSPIIPSEKRCKLRVELLSEELKELETAIKENDLVEIADALCDIQYVLSGAVLEFGLAEKFPSLIDEVQRSNMSKACSTIEIAEATVEYYTKERGFKCSYEKSGDKYLVFRDDRKVLKSVHYSAADLEPILK